MYDIVFCSVPPLAIDRVYSAPALLKGLVQSKGYKSKTYDFSIELYKQCNKDPKVYTNLLEYFWSTAKILSDTEKIIIEKWYQSVIHLLKNCPTRFIGLSVFSGWTQKAILEILLKAHEEGFANKIVLGGHGLTTTVHYTAQKLLPNKNINDKIYTFEQALRSKQLCDHIIIGDGESGILDLLRNNSVKNTQYTDEQFDYFLPNYDDYELDCYTWENDETIIDVIGSKGCVRDCDMCDIRSKFGNYRFKDGERIADELIELNSTYGFRKFRFVDSLTNGSLLHFEKFIKRLAEYNQQTNKNIVWSGEYICRDFTNSKKDIDAYYSMLAASGAQGLTIGAESGSNAVLSAINKQTSVEALFFELEYFRKYNITSVLLLFTGHWSETETDFIDHCQLLVNLVPYSLSSTVIGVMLGTTFGLIHGSPSFGNSVIERHNDKFVRLWFNPNNPTNTLKTRLKRRIIVNKLATALNLPIVNEFMYLKPEFDFLSDNLNDINEFFINKGGQQSDIDITNFVTTFLNNLNNIQFEVEIEVSTVNTDPSVHISINNDVLVNTVLTDGVYSFSKTLNAENSNLVKISMGNKNINDTIVENNIIIKDKSVKFKKLLINNVDILNPTIYYNIISMFEGATRLNELSMGLFKNDQTLEIKFPKNFTVWISKNYNSNKSWQNITNNALTDSSIQELVANLELLVDQIKI